jgi:hypothetical protein
MISIAGSNAGGNPAANRNDEVVRRLTLKTSGFCLDAMMPLSDTAPASKQRQMQLELAMTGEQRILWALEASVLVREFTKAGIRSRNPDWNEARVARELLRLQFLPAKLPPGLR